ncbi:MAG: flagellar biosynthetic protein FliO [Nitrospinae bacterium]|nr:flagellar biosynthetic protein FliO [Nitrospinota bacterium]
MKKIFILPIVLIFLASEASGATKLDNLRVFAGSKGNALEFKFNFNKPFNGKIKTEYLKGLVKVELSNTQIDPSSRTFSVSDKYVNSIRAIQHDKNSVMLNFNLGNAEISLENAFSSKISGNEISFYVNKKKIINLNSEKKTAGDAKTKRAQKISDIKMKHDSNNKLEDNILKIASLMSDSSQTDGIAFADEVKKGQTINGSDVPDIYSAALKMIVSLGVILLLLYLTLKFLKKRGMVNGNKTIFGKEKNIKIHEKTFLDNKKNISIVEIYGEVMAVGVTENGISLISKFSDSQRDKYLMGKDEGNDQRVEEPSKKASGNRLKSFLSSNKEDEDFKKMLSTKFDAFEKDAVNDKPVEKKEKTSIIEEINREKDAQKAQKIIEMLSKTKNLEENLQRKREPVAKNVAIPPKKEVPKLSQEELIAQEYFARKNRLKQL